MDKASKIFIGLIAAVILVYSAENLMHWVVSLALLVVVVGILALPAGLVRLVWRAGTRLDQK